jgi:hypothetical protein
MEVQLRKKHFEEAEQMAYSACVFETTVNLDKIRLATNVVRMKTERMMSKIRLCPQHKDHSNGCFCIAATPIMIDETGLSHNTTFYAIKSVKWAAAHLMRRDLRLLDGFVRYRKLEDGDFIDPISGQQVKAKQLFNNECVFSEERLMLANMRFLEQIVNTL